jgi:UPF0755 protein
MYNKNFFYFLGTALFLLFFYFLFFSTPKNFPVGVVFKIEQGDNLRDVSLLLQREHIIRSRLAFEALVIIYGGEKHIIYADYLFENKLPVWQIAKRISTGEHHLAPVVVTIPEGFNTGQIADIFASKLENFNKNKFISGAKGLEGRLFPDTYFFFTTANEKDVLQSMSENFNKKIKLILPEITKISQTTGRTEQEIIIMASIIERESKGESDREFISGILWKRIKLGIPLQVDAVPATYKSKGLPENPIANPGLETIKAALYPKSSPYLYYLHDKDGNIHYARTFAEHRQNILRYLP